MNQRMYRNSGFSLIEILVVMAIIVTLSAIATGVYLGNGKGAPPGKAHSPMGRARDTVCIENIRSVRQSIAAYQTTETEEHFPTALTDMRELSADFRSCPVGREPYNYDPATGQVHCVHPGHENY